MVVNATERTYVGTYNNFIIRKEVIFVGPVTTNPWLIAIINMAIVFAVLIALGVLMSLIQVIDPTKKKK